MDNKNGMDPRPETPAPGTAFETQDYTLQKPFTFAGMRYDRLTLREAKGKDLKEMDKHKGDVAKGQALLARCADLHPDVIDEMSSRDITAATKIVTDWMGNEEEESGSGR